jgi:hypothetical protein
VKHRWTTRARELLLPDPPADQRIARQARSSYERFAIPFTFKPRLSVPAAVIASIGALLRILLGSLLFAVWGTYSLLVWSTVHNPLARAGVLLPLFVLFLLAMALLMFTISAVVGRLAPETRDRAPADRMPR